MLLKVTNTNVIFVIEHRTDSDTIHAAINQLKYKEDRHIVSFVSSGCEREL